MSSCGLVDFEVKAADGDRDVFDIHVQSFTSSWVVEGKSWLDFTSFRVMLIEKVEIRQKRIVELGVKAQYTTVWQREQKLQDFLTVLCTQPKYLGVKEIQDFLLMDERDRLIVRGKIKLNHKLGLNKRAHAPVAEEKYAVHVIRPRQPEPGNDPTDEQRRYVKRTLSICSDGKVFLTSPTTRVAKEKIKGSFRCEDIVAIATPEYGVEDTVTIFIGRRFWCLSFDSGSAGLKCKQSLMKYRDEYQEKVTNVVVEEAPLHVIGVVKSLCKQCEEKVQKIDRFKKRNREDQFDIDQWEDIVNTREEDLEAKQDEIVKEFETKIQAEKDAAAIQNSFNKAILEERQRVLNVLVNPDVFNVGSFKPTNTVHSDAKADTDFLYHPQNTQIPSNKYTIDHHHFHHHKTVNKHIYHHYPSQKSQDRQKSSKKNELVYNIDDGAHVARETHSYTNTFTQTLIDIVALSRVQKLGRRKKKVESDHDLGDEMADGDDSVDVSFATDEEMVEEEGIEEDDQDERGTVPVSGGPL